MYATSSIRSISQPVQRTLPSTPGALGAELAAVLRSIGVHAVVTDARGTVIAASPEAAHCIGRAADSGRQAVPVRICGQSLYVVVSGGAVPPRPLDLTPRQRVVVELIAEGLRNREIAERLGISLHTVRRHVEALLQRLGVQTRAAAAVLLREQLGLAGPITVPRVPRHAA